ncbi:hypothetical protein [Streptomyces sp. NPDC056242]|uniref:hypothetical protein n=1 Tax=Streptomyces sp. NPDC056242 TaxID=3345760 RepID=UPI0035D7AAC3
MTDTILALVDRAEQAEKRLRLAHQARRAKEHQLDDIRRAMCDAEIIKDDDPFGHADLADVIRQAKPAEAEGYAAKGADLEQQLAQLRAGEENGYDPFRAPTPGQWLARFNEATVAERLDVVKQIIRDNERASRCFLMAHDQRLDEDRKARAKLARAQEEVARWKLNTLEPQTMRAVSDIGRALDGEPAPAPREKEGE